MVGSSFIRFVHGNSSFSNFRFPNKTENNEEKMNLYSYLSTVNRLWNNEDGNGVARFIALNGNHASNANLQVEHPDMAIERSSIPSPLDEVINSHIKVLFYIHSDRKKTIVITLRAE